LLASAPAAPLPLVPMSGWEVVPRAEALKDGQNGNKRTIKPTNNGWMKFPNPMWADRQNPAGPPGHALVDRHARRLTSTAGESAPISVDSSIKASLPKGA
jgi:hypothetical protein